MSIQKIKLLIFTSYLGSGGAEKHVVRLVNHLNPDRFLIEVVVPNRSGSYEEELLPHIKLTKVGWPLGRISSTLMRLSCLFPLRRIVRVRPPDILFSVMDVHNLIAVAGVRSVSHPPRLVLGIQNSVTDLYGSSGWVGRQILKRIPRDYPAADHIVALSQGVADDVLRLVSSLKDKLTVIHNCGYDDFLLKKLREGKVPLPTSAVPQIVACGRLEPQKGYPYLLRAFAKVRKKRECRLWIIGQGKERGMLEKMANQLGVASSVQFLGFQSNPYVYMAAADLFVLSSLHEGFGNVLVEAMACGTPVVSSDCPHGPNEIITHSQNGWLVAPADELSLANAITHALDNPTLRMQFVRQGKETARQFHAQAIADRHEQLFLELLRLNAK